VNGKMGLAKATKVESLTMAFAGFFQAQPRGGGLGDLESALCCTTRPADRQRPQGHGP
jgi:hypothetical protein